MSNSILTSFRKFENCFWKFWLAKVCPREKFYKSWLFKFSDFSSLAPHVLLIYIFVLHDVASLPFCRSFPGNRREGNDFQWKERRWRTKKPGNRSLFPIQTISSFERAVNWVTENIWKKSSFTDFPKES